MYCFQVQHNNCITGILLRALSSEEKKTAAEIVVNVYY